MSDVCPRCGSKRINDNPRVWSYECESWGEHEDHVQQSMECRINELTRRVSELEEERDKLKQGCQSLYERKEYFRLELEKLDNDRSTLSNNSDEKCVICGVYGWDHADDCYEKIVAVKKELDAAVELLNKCSNRKDADGNCVGCGERMATDFHKDDCPIAKLVLGEMTKSEAAERRQS